MRVLWCHPNAWSGEYKMLAWLAAQGQEICVLQSDRNLGAARRLEGGFKTPSDGIQTFWYNPAKGAEKLLTSPVDHLVKRSPYRGNLGRRMWMIAAAARHFKPDVVYCSEGFGYGVAAALLKKLHLLEPALVVQSIGGDFMDEPQAEYGTRRTAISRWLLQQVLQHSTRIKPVSPLLVKVMASMGGVREKIRMSPSHLVAELDFLKRTYLQRDALRVSVRQRYGIPTDAPVITSLSGNWMGKGTHLIAEAWKDIRQRVPGCRWILAGPQPGWYLKNVHPLVQQFPDEILEVGELHGEDVFNCYAAADLNVVPTLADGLNMVAVEAMAVGTPTLVTDRAGIAAWVGGIDPRLVVAGDSANALLDGIVQFFCLNEAERQNLSERVKAVSEEFELENLAPRLVAIWEEAVALGKSSGSG